MMFLEAALTGNGAPLRIRLASSGNTPSRTLCRPFSIPQWLRVKDSNLAAPACSRVRL